MELDATRADLSVATSQRRHRKMDHDREFVALSDRDPFHRLTATLEGRGANASDRFDLKL